MALQVGWPLVHTNHSDVRIFDEFLGVTAGSEADRHDSVEWQGVVPVSLKWSPLRSNPVVYDPDEAIAFPSEVFDR